MLFTVFSIGFLGGCFEDIPQAAVAEDTIPPAIDATTPADGATDVAVNTVISVTFSEAMDTALTEAAFGVSPATDGTVAWSGADTALTFTPSADLDFGTEYTVTVSATAADAAGNGLAAAISFSFTTGQPGGIPAAPTGLSATAGEGQIELSWDEVAGADSYNLYWASSTGVTTGSATLIEGVTSPYTHTGLPDGSTYYYAVAAVNAAGEGALSGEANATTLGTPPTVSGTNPADGADDVSVTTVISVTFSEAMDTALTEAAFGVSPLTGGTVSWSDADTILTFTPSADLEFGTEYSITVSAIAADAAGNSLEAAVSFSFTTGQPAGVPSAPTGLSATAGNGQIELTWNAVAGADSYNLYWATTAGVTAGSGTLIAEAASPYTHSGLPDGSTYYYAVAAVNGIGEGALSTEVSETTLGTLVDIIAPSVSSTLPTNGQQNVGIFSPIIITFSEPMNIVSAQGAFSLNPSAAGAFSWSGGNSVLTFTPDGAGAGYDPNATLQVVIATGAKDMNANALASSVTITFTTTGAGGIAGNYAPVALNGDSTTDEDTPLDITMVANDPNGDSVIYTVVDSPTSGSLSGSGATRTYTPDADFNGGDSFTFKAGDGYAEGNTATVTITVTAVEDGAPSPVSQTGPNTVGTTEDSASVTITLAADDPDPEQVSGLTYKITALPGKGSLIDSGAVTINGGALPYTLPDNQVDFLPAADEVGADSFAFVANDGTADSAAGAVALDITAVEDGPPTADGQTGFDKADTTEDSAGVAITLTADDPDPEQVAGLIFVLTNGTVTANGGSLTGTQPNLTYHPPEDFNGLDSFTFYAVDSSAQSSNTATVEIAVSAVSDGGPTAFGQTVGGGNDVTTNEDTPVAITLGATDPDPEQRAGLVYNLPGGTATAQGGTLSGTAPNLTYQPATDWNNDWIGGPDSFTFSVTDADSNTGNTATVEITVAAVSKGSPTATPQAGATTEDTPVAITLAATDPDPEQVAGLTFTVASLPGNGTLTQGATVLAADDTVSGNTVTYTPDEDYNNSGTPDSFTFTATDADANTSTAATVEIAVGAVNDAPAATPQSNVQADEEVTKSITLAGTDVDVDTLSYHVTSLPADGILKDSNLVVLTAGALPYALPSATVSYTSNTDYNGGDGFGFLVNDGTVNSNPAAVTITVIAVNDAPVAQAQGLPTTNGITNLSITLGGSDVDTVTLSYLVTGIPGKGIIKDSDLVTITLGVLPYTLPGNGNTVTYDHTDGTDGLDSFKFKIDDGQGDNNLSNEATVTVDVGATNSAPVAYGQTGGSAVGTDEDNAVDITLTGFDTNGVQVAFILVGAPTAGGVNMSANTVTYDSPSKISSLVVPYTPNANYNGTDSLIFRVNDGTLDSNLATVEIVIAAIPDGGPTANNATFATSEDVGGGLAITLTASDPDPEQVAGLTFILPGGTATAQGGVLSGSAPNLTYQPAIDWNNDWIGGPDSFTFTVTDANSNTSVAGTISINVSAVSDGGPTATAQSGVAATEDTTKAITLAGTDLDPEQDGALSYKIMSLPMNGSLMDSNSVTISTPLPYTLPDNSVTYAPDPDYNGGNSFFFAVTDSDGNNSANATVAIDVAAVNDAPVASDRAYASPEDVTIFINLAGGASDAETAAASLSYIIEALPTKGTLYQSDQVTAVTSVPTTIPGTAVYYVPNANWYGADSFSISLDDGSLGSNTASVYLTYTSVEDTPVIGGAPATTVGSDSPYSFNPTASDGDGDLLTFSITGMPSPWAAFDSGTGTLSGTPAESDVATYSGITICVTDGNATPCLTPFSIQVFDDTAPAKGTLFRAIPGPYYVDLSWINPPGSSGVKVLRKTTGYPADETDGFLALQGTGMALTDGGLTPGQQYYYALFPYDNASASAPTNGPNYAAGARATTITGGWRQLSAGDQHTLALRANGTVWAWGNGGSGRLGDGGGSANGKTPLQVCTAGPVGACAGYLTGVTAVAAGSTHSLALKSDGTVWGWGQNNLGQLGDGTNGNKYIASQVTDPADGSGFLQGVAAISAGFYFSTALKNDGAVLAWGYNQYGKLGNGTTSNSYTPVQVCADYDGGTQTCITPFKVDDAASSRLSSLNAHTLLMREDGTVWAGGMADSASWGTTPPWPAIRRYRSAPSGAGAVAGCT